MSNNNQSIVEFIVKQLDSDKAEDIVVIDLEDKATFAKFMVVATGTSSRHVKALSSILAEKLKQNFDYESVRTEGDVKSDWVLLDAGDIVVNIFKPEMRENVNIETLWQRSSIHDASIAQKADDNFSG